MTLMTIFVVYILYIVAQALYERCKSEDTNHYNLQEPTKYEQIREALIEKVESMPILRQKANYFEIENIYESD